MRVAVRLLSLFRQNPRAFGRNKDIDLVKIADWDVPTTAIIDTSETADVKARASACHASQQMPQGRGSNPIVRLFFRRTAGKEFFSQIYPPVAARVKRSTLG